jgi:hypothetical protein
MQAMILNTLSQQITDPRFQTLIDDFLSLRGVVQVSTTGKLKECIVSLFQCLINTVHDTYALQLLDGAGLGGGTIESEESYHEILSCMQIILLYIPHLYGSMNFDRRNVCDSGGVH